MPEVTGYRALAERLARGLWTPSSCCPWWPAWRGTDLRLYLLSKAPADVIAAVARKQCLKDEQVRTCKATAEKTGSTISLSLVVVAEDVGPFSFVLTISEAVVSLVELQVG